MAHFILSHYQSEIRNNLPDDSLIHNQLDETTCLMEKKLYFNISPKKTPETLPKISLRGT